MGMIIILCFLAVIAQVIICQHNKYCCFESSRISPYVNSRVVINNYIVQTQSVFPQYENNHVLIENPNGQIYLGANTNKISNMV